MVVAKQIREQAWRRRCIYMGACLPCPHHERDFCNAREVGMAWSEVA